VSPHLYLLAFREVSAVGRTSIAVRVPTRAGAYPKQSRFLPSWLGRSTGEAAEFLDRAAREHFPESAYALGKGEWERRNQPRKDRHRNN
jgi:hypothetical protein